MSRRFNCPACGGEVEFRSPASIFSVCPYCRMTCLRRDVNIETLGKMAELPTDSSVLQIGVVGKYEKRDFCLVGRIRQEWTDGLWSEWYALFGDGSEGWLAEAQGSMMMSFEVPGAEAFAPPRSTIRVGLVVKVPKLGEFEVTDIKEATCTGSEGELPFPGPQGRQALSVDLSGQDDRFGCLDYSAQGVRFYAGKYVEFEQLGLSGLRTIDGW